MEYQKQLMIWLVIKITEVWQNSQQNSSETITNKHGKEIPKERYISPEEGEKLINNLGLDIIIL